MSCQDPSAFGFLLQARLQPRKLIHEHRANIPGVPTPRVFPQSSLRAFLSCFRCLTVWHLKRSFAILVDLLPFSEAFQTEDQNTTECLLGVLSPNYEVVQSIHAQHRHWKLCQEILRCSDVTADHCVSSVLYCWPSSTHSFSLQP